MQSLCQAWHNQVKSVSADERKKRASSEKASERKMRGRERRGKPASISANTSVRPLPHSLPEKPFLVSKWRMLKYQNVPCRRVSHARFVFSLSLHARSNSVGTLRSNDVTATRTSLKKRIAFFHFQFHFYVLVAVVSLDLKIPIDVHDVMCQNWPIIGYTRSWYSGIMYWQQCIQVPLTHLSAALPRFSHNFSLCAFFSILEPGTDWVV